MRTWCFTRKITSPCDPVAVLVCVITLWWACFKLRFSGCIPVTKQHGIVYFFYTGRKASLTLQREMSTWHPGDGIRSSQRAPLCTLCGYLDEKLRRRGQRRGLKQSRVRKKLLQKSSRHKGGGCLPTQYPQNQECCRTEITGSFDFSSGALFH